jgi:predicted aldo/keto reductase-like oxidoreductase
MASDCPDQNRRKFLSQASFAVATAGLARVPHPWVTGGQAPSAQNNGRPLIERTLGKTGIRIPIVSMGVMNCNNPEIIKRAYDAGVRFFDTAQSYQGGRNEEMLGSVIAQMGVRDKVIIQTKVEVPRVPAGSIRSRVLQDFAGCLKRLKMEYVDIMLIHQITNDMMNNPEIIEALKEAKSQKLARFVGVSTHQETAVLNSAAAAGFCDVIQFRYNFLNADDKDMLQALKNASSKGTGLIAMKTQTGGRSRNAGPLNQTAMLKWVLQHPEITTAVPGYTNFDQVAESISVAFGLDYTSEEKSWLGDRSVRLAIQFCRQCETCLPTCPRGVDVPTLMRTHMYAASYANFYQARETLDGIHGNAGLKNCAGCTDCTARCRYNVNIRENIAELKAMYV